MANENKVQFTITRSGSTSSAVTADYAVTFETGNTAVAADLGTTLSGTVTIPTNSSTATADITVIDDTLIEGNQTFTLTLSNPTGASLSTTNKAATGTITDDDSITLGEAFGIAWEGETFEFFASATAPTGLSISSYEFDPQNDGTFDVSGTHQTAINGALVSSTIPSSDVEDGDDGSYTGKVRVTLNSGSYQDFDLPVTIGNTPPRIDLSDDGFAIPGAPFQLYFNWNDPGPDSISSQTVEWGDGSSNTFTAFLPFYTHTYATTGIYTVKGSVTDEDGTYSATRIVLIGDTNEPEPISTDPKIESPTVTNLGGGLVQLSIEVKDQFDMPIVPGVNGTIAWDLNNDDSEEQYVDALGAIAVTLSPLPGTTDTYVAKVKVVDQAGNETYAQFSFTGTTPPTPEPTVRNYRERFKHETPGMPSGWKVHHSIPQGGGILEQRYLKERKPPVNIHETKYLRAVHHDYHTEITNSWNAWFVQQAEAVGRPGPNATFNQKRAWAMENVSLDLIDAKAAQVDAEWGSKMVRAGKNQSRRFAEIGTE